jgi:hypothetical protein
MSPTAFNRSIFPFWLAAWRCRRGALVVFMAVALLSRG